MTKPKPPTDWINHVDPDDIAAAHDQTMTDSYGDSEQHTRLLAAMEDKIGFPFKAGSGKRARLLICRV